MVQTSSLCPSLSPPPGISDPWIPLLDLIFAVLLTPSTQGGPGPQYAISSASRKSVCRGNRGGAKVLGVPSTSWSCPCLGHRLSIILRTSCVLKRAVILLQVTEDVLGLIPMRRCHILRIDGLYWAHLANPECTLYFKI